MLWCTESVFEKVIKDLEQVLMEQLFRLREDDLSLIPGEHHILHSHRLLHLLVTVVYVITVFDELDE